MNLLLSLFISMSFAVENDCNDLLSTASVELNSAYIENRSKFLSGQISEWQFENMRKELEMRSSKLGAYSSNGARQEMPRVNKSAISVEAEVDIELKEVLNKKGFADIGGIVDAEFDPVSMAAIITINSEVLDDSSGVPFLAGQKTPYALIEDKLSKITLKGRVLGKKKYHGHVNTVAWPTGESKFLVIDEKRGVLYDAKSDKALKSLRYKAGRRLTHSNIGFSGRGSWYFDTQGLEEDPIVLYSTDRRSKDLMLDLSFRDYSFMKVSYLENYMLIANARRAQLVDLRSKGIVFELGPEVISNNISDVSISYDEKDIYLRFQNNLIKVLNIEKLVDLKRIIGSPTVSSYFEAAAMPWSFLLEEKNILKMSFSPDGRYLAVLNAGDNLKTHLVLIDLYSQSIIFDDEKSMAYPGHRLKTDLKFSYDSQYISIFNENEIKVLKIVEEERQAIQ